MAAFSITIRSGYASAEAIQRVTLMLDFLPGPVKGCISLFFYALNTVVLCTLLLIFALIKLAVPPLASPLSSAILTVSKTWIRINNINNRLINNVEFIIRGGDDLKEEDWYLVVSNHQSWVDILILQKVFNNRIPFLKFFLKKELIWVPFLGLAWWALDFPFMQRYSRSFLEKHPHLRGKDLETTRRACRKFKNRPTSVMNFAEGTRFTEKKHQILNSPYKNLLPARAGGIAFVLTAMNGSIRKILDVTICYPDGVESFWGFLCGRVRRVDVHISSIPVTGDLVGDYFNDEKFKADFQEWLNSLWLKKDRLLDELKEKNGS